MGGFNLGELAGVLKLDDSQYRQTIADSAAAAALLTVKLSDVGASVQQLDRELRSAGFNLKETQGYLNSLRAQGLSTADAVDQITQSIKKLQAAIVSTHMESLGGVKGLSPDATKAAVAARGGVTEPFKAQWDALQKDLAMASEKMKAQLDKDAQGRQREVFAQVQSEVTERLRVEKEVTASRQRLDEDAKKRSHEMQSQMQGDMAYAERIEKEKADAVLAAQRVAQARERAQFFEHRRQMQLAQAATTVGITAVAVGGAGVGAGLFVGTQAAQFQDAMAKSLAVIGDVSDQTKAKIAANAREAAKETGLAAKDIAADFAIAAKGGLDVAQSLEFVPKAAKFAIATNSELHESTRQVITIMEAMQLPVTATGKVLDELTVANQLARGSVDSLATMLEGKAGAALRSAKVSLEEALAMTVAFSKAGVSASQGQTFLTQVIERLLSAARQYGDEIVDVGGKQMKFKDIVYLSDGSVRPFIQTLKLLDEAFKGRSAESIGKFFDDIHLGSARGAQGLKIFLSQSGMIDEITKKFPQLANAMGLAFDQQMQSPLNQLARLKAQLNDVAITLGIPTVAAVQSLANALKPALDGLQSLAAKFSALPQPVQTAIALLGGVGSVSILAGGGLLLLAGHVIRLVADLKLLVGSEALGGVLTSLTGYAATFATIALGITTIGAAIAGVIDLQNKLKNQEAINAGKGSTGSKIGAGLINFAVPSLILGQFVGSKDAVKEAASTSGDDTGKAFMDGFRKQLEEMKKAMADAFKPGDLGVNPEKVLKAALKIEDIRQRFVAFSDEYSALVDKLNAEQQQVIADGMNRVNGLMTAGADPRVALKALSSLQEDLKRFQKDAAAQEKIDSQALAQENAAASVQAFKDKYQEQLVTFPDSIRVVMASVTGALQSMVDQGLDPKRIQAALREAEDVLAVFDKSVQNHKRVEDMLAAADRKFDTAERRAQKQKPEIIGPEFVMPPQFAQTFLSNLAIQPELSKITLAMHALGLESQQDLDLARNSAEQAYISLKDLNAPVDMLREAWLKARAAEDNATEGFKPLRAEFKAIHAEINGLQSDGDLTNRVMDLENLGVKAKILKINSEGLGSVYKSLVDSALSGLGNIGDILIKMVVDTKNALQDLKNLFTSVLSAILGSLLKLAVTKILIKLFPELADPTVKTQAANTAATVQHTAATRAETEAEKDNTIAVDNLTDAINRLIAAMRDQAQQGSGDGGAGFLGKIVGGLLGAGVGLLTGGVAIPAFASMGVSLGGSMLGHAEGGLMTRTHPALVHGGEYIANPTMTKQLQSVLDKGMLFDGGGSGSDHFDFRGAHFGAGLTAGKVEAMMRPVVSKLRRSGGRSRNGKF